MSERSIEYVSLRKLRADPRNPKAHAGEAIEHSVDRFGFVEPIVVDERTGFIASGHGRVETLTRMRVDKKAAPKGVKVTGKGDWLVPVVKGWESASDAEAGAALIAFNRTTELGGWVDEALLDLLQEIDDAEGLGFDSDEIADLEATVAAEAAAREKRADVDDVPETTVVSQAVPSRRKRDTCLGEKRDGARSLRLPLGPPRPRRQAVVRQQRRRRRSPRSRRRSSRVLSTRSRLTLSSWSRRCSAAARAPRCSRSPSRARRASIRP